MTEQDTLESVTLCRQLTCQLVALQLGCPFRNSTIHGKSQAYKSDCSADVYEGMLEVPRLHEVQIMGVLVNPLY